VNFHKKFTQEGT